MKFTPGCLSSLETDTQLYAEIQVVVHEDGNGLQPCHNGQNLLEASGGELEIFPEHALVAANILSCDSIK